MAERKLIHHGSRYTLARVERRRTVVAPGVVYILPVGIVVAVAVHSILTNAVSQRLAKCVVGKELQAVDLLALHCGLQGMVV